MAEMRHARRTRGEVEVRGKVQRNASTQTGSPDLASVLFCTALARNNKLATRGGGGRRGGRRVQHVRRGGGSGLYKEGDQDI